MTAKELSIKNIEDNGFRTGRAIRSVGTEIIRGDSRIAYFNSVTGSSLERRLRVKESLEDENFENLYISYVVIESNSDEKNIVLSKGDEIPSLEELYENNFQGLSEISIYKRYPEPVGVVPLSKFGKDLYSQQELMVKVYSLIGLEIDIDGMDTSDYDLDNTDDTLDTSYYNNDYSLVHGDNAIVLNTSNSTYVNGRANNYNYSVDTDFWNFTYKEELKPFLAEIDPDGEATVYHRKGKDWYIAATLSEQEINISYYDKTYSDVDDEVFYVLAKSTNSKKLVSDVVNIIDSFKKDYDNRSFIYNELEIGGYGDNPEYYNQSIVNNDVVDFIYDDKQDLLEEIKSSISFGKEEISSSFSKAYNNAIYSHCDILDDLTVVITRFDEDKSTKYNQLKILKRMGKKNGWEVKKTALPGSSVKEWAIIMGDEEYHFDIVELIVDIELLNTDLRMFLRDVMVALQKRREERIKEKDLYSKAKMVFVGVSDSLDSGNCNFGTRDFINRHNINTNVTGGIRGDVLLDMESTSYTKRAVIMAIDKASKKDVE